MYIFNDLHLEIPENSCVLGSRALVFSPNRYKVNKIRWNCATLSIYVSYDGTFDGIRAEYVAGSQLSAWSD